MRLWRGSIRAGPQKPNIPFLDYLKNCAEESKMTGNWKSLEDHVRGIAQLRWNIACNPEHIDGVDFDGVVRVSPDEIILIEITQECTLSKVRRDLNKIMPTKMRLASEGVICRAFVVLDIEPTNSMEEAGRKVHIAVLSSAQFERIFFDFAAYQGLRMHLPFGSAVDAKTGENDTREFVPVNYVEPEDGSPVSIDEVVSRLLKGTRIALTGDFGTGKSRCVREVFASLSTKVREAGAFPVSINLRDHWSSSNALEVLAGHLGNVGLSSSIDNLVRLLNTGRLILLLDGFDEIGAQSHDTNVDDRKALRRHAVRGVRDLLQRSKAGALVTGRSHFFDSDEEMLQSLGILGARSDTTCVLRAPDSFSQAEGQRYLNAMGIAVTLPEWLPRKPLVFQILVELDTADVKRMLCREHGQFTFWGTFISAVCARESRGVADSIAPLTIRAILLELASKTRHSSTFLGRLSPRDIDEAYEVAVGTAPDQTGRQLLARMCTLGRIEPESPDRQFVDYNVVDILRGERLVNDVVALSESDTKVQWKQSLRILGVVHVASSISAFDLSQSCFSYLRKFGNTANATLLGEIIASLSVYGKEKLDFQGLQISHAELPVLNVSTRAISNLCIKDSIINFLALEACPVKEADYLVIENSLITTVAGVSSLEGLPQWIKDTEVIEFDSLSNSARIKESPLLPQQKLFLAIIHKIFFQPGAGREEGSLLKGGYGQKYDPKLVDSILKMLLREKLIERFKGRDRWVYKPVRRHSERLNRIRSELTLSEDTLWQEATNLN